MYRYGSFRKCNKEPNFLLQYVFMWLKINTFAPRPISCYNGLALIRLDIVCKRVLYSL